MVEPTTLQIAETIAPLAVASRTAAKVSAVSPDWLIGMTRVLGSMIGLR